MDLDNEVFDWIERYLNGDMNAEELAHFNMLLSGDASLKSKVERQKNFAAVLSNLGRRQALKSSLDRFHAGLPVEDLVTQLMPARTRIYRLWKKHRVGLAIAASVLILAVSGSMYYMNLKQIDGQISQVKALRRDVERVKSSQHAIITHLDGKKNHASGSANYGGTGFLIDSRGFLVTNFHVVEGADSVFVQSSKGQSFKTAVVYRSREYDLAILEIRDTSFKTPGALPYTFSRIQPELGEQVYTLGYPRDEIVYNEGYMSSATGFQGDTVSYQLSIPVNPGNSGGPVLDGQGNVLGIISGKQTLADGVAFAVRSSCLLKIIAAHSIDSSASVAGKGPATLPSVHIALPVRTQLRHATAANRRVQQVKRMTDFIYNVKAY